MDQKQFERLQASVQWVADEANRPFEPRRDREKDPIHNQRTWGSGRLTDDVAINIGNGLVEWRVVCTTNCCLAGHGVLAAGDRMIATAHPQFVGQRVPSNVCIDTEGRTHSINERAKELFGLTFGESERLFNGAKSADTIVSEAKRIAAEHGYQMEVIE